MNEPNHPSEGTPARELDVDEAFEHWSELAKRLGASQPGESWDQARETTSPVVPPATRTREASSPTPSMETDWGEVATSLGVSVPVEFTEREPVDDRPARRPSFESGESRPRPETADPFPAPTRAADPMPVESTPWPSLWREESSASAPDRPVREEQAALDRMFGADSSRVFEPEHEAKSGYFDLNEEDDAFAAEVRFTPRGQPAPGTESSDRTDERGRRNRRGRRGSSRRRGRGSESRRPQSDSREESSPSSDFKSDDEHTDDFEFAPATLDDASDHELSSAELLDAEEPDTGSARTARHRKVASWKDAVGFIIDRNLASRDRDTSDGNRRRRGGRRR